MKAPAAGAPVRLTVELQTGTLALDIDEGGSQLDSLLGFAARANGRRGFLFLSKVLGKHWPARPRDMRAAQLRLAHGVPDAPGTVAFIAMAETAIGLGQGVFEAWCRINPGRQAVFLHTTRHPLDGLPVLEFDEAHSHARRQFLHLPRDGAIRDQLGAARTLVLVDDEASTGNTFLNLAQACRAWTPCVQRLHLATLTNFTGAGTQIVSDRLGMPVTCGSLLAGSFRFSGSGHVHPAAHAQGSPGVGSQGASAAFGRAGLDTALARPEAFAHRLAATIEPGQRVLVLGTGEFMHAPALLAAELEQAGVDVHVQATTRSPLLNGWAVGHMLSFADNYGEGIANFLYNVRPGQYDQVLLCHETAPVDSVRALALRLQARQFHFHSETDIEEIPFCRP